MLFPVYVFFQKEYTKRKITETDHVSNEKS